MNTILLVEDEKGISKIIKSYLEKSNFSVIQAFDGAEAIKLFNETFDLVILDRMLPTISGDQVLEFIRKTSQIPVIMVTAKAEEDDRIDGFKLGADDYVVKPFSPRELVERVKARLKNRTVTTNENNVKSFDSGALTIDFDAQTAIVKGKEVALTANEYKILETLYSKPGKIFTRDEIISIAFGYEYGAYDRTIDTYVKNLRQKIEENPKEPKYIKTVYGIGYKAGEK